MTRINFLECDTCEKRDEKAKVDWLTIDVIRQASREEFLGGDYCSLKCMLDAITKWENQKK